MSARARDPGPDFHAIEDGLTDVIEWAQSKIDTLPPDATAERRALSFVVAEARVLRRSCSGARAFYRVAPRDV